MTKLAMIVVVSALAGLAHPTRADEVIVIVDHVPPAIKPKPKNYVPTKTPPYSDEAVLTDAWERAWLLLDLDDTGAVTRIKFLKHPGHDLEPIARSEAFKLQFEPARDATGRAIRSTIIWGYEWPSAWWLSTFVGVRSAMPPIIGFPPRRMDEGVPCAGSGPLQLDSVHPVYKDCSTPDLSRADKEPWLRR